MTTPQVNRPRVPEWTWADRVRKVRRESRLSQSAFAKLIGQGEKAVAAWETGKNKPRDKEAVAKRIQLALGWEASWMLGVSSSRPTPPGWAPGDSNAEPADYKVPTWPRPLLAVA